MLFICVNSKFLIPELFLANDFTGYRLCSDVVFQRGALCRFPCCNFRRRLQHMRSLRAGRCWHRVFLSSYVLPTKPQCCRTAQVARIFHAAVPLTPPGSRGNTKTFPFYPSKSINSNLILRDGIKGRYYLNSYLIVMIHLTYGLK